MLLARDGWKRLWLSQVIADSPKHSFLMVRPGDPGKNITIECASSSHALFQSLSYLFSIGWHNYFLQKAEHLLALLGNSRKWDNLNGWYVRIIHWTNLTIYWNKSIYRKASLIEFLTIGWDSVIKRITGSIIPTSLVIIIIVIPTALYCFVISRHFVTEFQGINPFHSHLFQLVEFQNVTLNLQRANPFNSIR